MTDPDDAGADPTAADAVVRPVSPWAPGGPDTGPSVTTDLDTVATEPRRIEQVAADTNEFEAIFGSPSEVRPLGQESLAHRRRGLAAAAGGGETLDRRRKGSSDDVLVTLLAHPASAAQRAVDGDALSAARRLRVDLEARRSERRDLVFDASLRTVLWARRPARLRLYGSASMNVTVLTLTPANARRRPSRWFVRAGNKAMERVVDQLASEVEPLRWQPPPDETASAAERAAS